MTIPRSHYYPLTHWLFFGDSLEISAMWRSPRFNSRLCMIFPGSTISHGQDQTKMLLVSICAYKHFTAASPRNDLRESPPRLALHPGRRKTVSPDSCSEEMKAERWRHRRRCCWSTVASSASLSSCLSLPPKTQGHNLETFRSSSRHIWQEFHRSSGGCQRQR